MTHTPKEAKYKYCPFLTTSQDKLKFCQTDGCMMWRWASRHEQGESAPGYCGLAGTPAEAAGS